MGDAAKAAVAAMVVEFAQRSEQQHARQQSDVERQREARFVAVVAN
jgi:hypothetical protein